MKTDQRRWKHPLRLAVAIAFLVTPMLNCDHGDTTTNKTVNSRNSTTTNAPLTPTLTPTPTPTPKEDSSKVSRRDASVALGPSETSLQALTDNNWHSLRTGDHVTTDASGEAQLNILDCMTVYLFKDSELVSSACPKSSSKGGNVSCAAAGTSLFNNSCGSKVIIETGSAEIQLEGTYLSVTYVPSKQLTLVMVLKGKVSVKPVTNFAERTLGEPIEVSEGYLFLSVPDNKKAEISSLDLGVVLRQPQPLSQIGDLRESLNLGKWLDKIGQQAKADGIAIPRGSSGIGQSHPPIEINCDCESVSAGLLTRPYRKQCKEAEKKLKDEYQRTGKLTGVCDPVASGPKARPTR